MMTVLLVSWFAICVAAVWLLCGCVAFDDIYVVAGVASYILKSQIIIETSPSDLYLIMHVVHCPRSE